MQCISGVSTIGYTTWYAISHATWCYIIDECDEQSACIPFWNQIYFHMFPNRSHCFPIGHHNFLKIPNGNHRQPEKSLISNLNNLFSRQLKKILNGQKFGNLFIFGLLKLGEIPLKLWHVFFHFLRPL